MEDKYYTPTLDEFHVGFEFEATCGSRLDQWGKDVFTQEDLWHGRPSTHETYRVKYLDHDDIVECGWRNSKDSSFFGIYGGSTVIHYGLKLHKDGRIEINAGDCDIVYFLGVIKNKSELKKLMKQLGIQK